MSIVSRDELIAALQHEGGVSQEGVARLPTEVFERGVYEQGWNDCQLLGAHHRNRIEVPTLDRTGAAVNRRHETPQDATGFDIDAYNTRDRSHAGITSQSSNS